MNKKLLSIVIGILIILLSGAGYWWFFMQDEETLQPTNGDEEYSFILGGEEGSFFEEDTDLSGLPNTRPTQEFLQITTEPVIGFNTLETTTGTSTGSFVRYVLRSNGHIYDYNLETGERTRISSISFSQAFNAKVIESGVFIQYLEGNEETIQTSFISFADRVPTETQLSEGIQNIAVRDSQFAWVRETGNEASIEVGSLSNLTPKTIYQSFFTEWVVEWEDDTYLLVSQRPSVSAEGFAYRLSKNGGNLSLILGGIEGLTVNTNNEGKRALYSRSTATSIGLFSKALSGDDLSSLQITRTLPEKCTFSYEDATFVYCGVPKTIPQASYPDDWYQGEVVFADKIELINTTNGNNEVLYDTDIDIVNPVITINEDHFIGRDKTSGMLWRLKL